MECPVPRHYENVHLAGDLGQRMMGDFSKNVWSSGAPRRIGVIIRGESYRSGHGQGDRNDTITSESRYWQDLASRSHVEKVIKPLEDCGFKVDVFVGTYDHPGLRPCASRQVIEDLLAYYKPRVKDKLIVPGSQKHHLTPDGVGNGGWGPSTMYEESFKLLTKRHREARVDYAAVLVIRHDVIFKRPLLPSYPDTDWGKVVFPFLERLIVDSVSDVFQWFPLKYVNCASECGYHGHNLGSCLVEAAGNHISAFVLPGSRNSNTEAEANPIYQLARPSAGEKRTAVLIVGDVERLPPRITKKGRRQARGSPANLKVTGRAFVEHVLKPNNADILDPHKHLDVFVHSWTPFLEREYRVYFTSVVKAEHDDSLEDWEPSFKNKLGGDLDDWKEVAWAFSIQRAFEMMRQTELSSGKRYDRVLILRPDTLLLSDLDLDNIMTKEDRYNIMTKEDPAGGPVYVSRQGPGPAKYLHFAMSRSRASTFANLYGRLPPKSMPEPGENWMSSFVKHDLEAELIEDDVVVGTDEEAYTQIPTHMANPCSQVQLRRMTSVGLTAEDAQALGLPCTPSGPPH